MDASRKNCPASMSANNWAKWTEFKNRVAGGGSATTGGATSTVDNNVLTIQKQLNAMNNAGLAEDGIMGAMTLQAIKNFQAKYGLSVDGIWGNQSAGKMAELYANLAKAQADAKALADKIKAQAEAKAKANAEAKTKAEQDNTEMYRIRKSWADVASQIGAYKDLEGAKEIADKNPDYIVYDSKGNMVYKKNIVKTLEQRVSDLENIVADLKKQLNK